MKIFGALFGIISLILMMIGFIPLLGWFNWISIPFAIVALIISSITGSASGKTMSIVAIFIGILRLMFGGGVF